MKIAFALIAHQNPETIERLIRLIVASGHVVALHYDARAVESGYLALLEAFEGNDSVRIVRKFHVSWGQWSIVAATLRCLDEIAEAGWKPDYVHLMSGADYPIRPIGEFAAFLERNAGKQFLECVPSDERRWVRSGMQQERYQYRFYFNWREQRTLFNLSLDLQKLFGLKRKFVRGIEPHMGSQWWTLTWDTIEKIIDLAREPDILEFFRTTLIPDELFFQTMVAHLVDFRQIVGRTLTLYQFTDFGVPVVYYADHVDYLLRQPFFFARKLSVHSPELQDEIEASWQKGVKRRPRSFPDDAFGRVGTEYEDYRISYRMGPPGRPVPGLSTNRWLDDLARLTKPYFCVLGASTIELRLMQQVLGHVPEILCHGQLFHSVRIEFAGDVDNYAGYDTDSIELTHISAPNFISDVIRSEKQRTSGFLLRWGQGWHMHEVLFTRPNARVAVLRGDPLMAFVESLNPIHPRLTDPLDLSPLFDLPAEALVHRFRKFVQEFCGFNVKINELMNSHAGAKPTGWASYIDLGAAARPKRGRALPSRTEAMSNTALLHWRGWMAQIKTCLGVEFQTDDAAWRDVLDALEQLEDNRLVAIDRLVACGINRTVLENLKDDTHDPNAVITFV